MRRPYWIPFNSDPYDFPPVEHALEHPDGLLAIGGDLSMKRLLVAYRKGIFPWFSDEEPILWWSPSERMVLFPEHLHISRSLKKTLRKQTFEVTFDQCFTEVIQHCAGPRRRQQGTWITQEMLNAYSNLHEHQYAHSVEIWYDGELVGGLYGVAIGKVFYGESMFALMADASKVAFVYFSRQLQRWGYELVDCQVYTNHLDSLGAVEIAREDYTKLLDHLCPLQGYNDQWVFDDLGWEAQTGGLSYGS
ncbi:leucyl/phenylalanyl-tRNA--protein transferase [Candidatus Albibeggiatoa sp. nov. BB20]|uniref:leucyl/phenylalanyl-tRNA--protein transferase n=1 Tax=Candidatus Albibeggiatoa sp. nov. BB20 TaxID=3162723 RepID=UPI0033659D45